MISHEEKMSMRHTIYEHLTILLNKVHKMFETDALTPAQMSFAGDILKDIAKADSALSKACYYESKNDLSEDKKY